MSDKKHIDRIFQEKLKDFEVAPNPEVWNNIQSKLSHEKEEPKKVIPFWLRLAGIAALLVLLFSIGSFVFNSTELIVPEPNQNTVDTNSSDVLSNDPLNNDIPNNNEQSEKDAQGIDDSEKGNTESYLVPSTPENEEPYNNSRKKTISSDVASTENEVITDADNIKTNSTSKNPSLNTTPSVDVADNTKSEKLKTNIKNSSNSVTDNNTIQSSQFEKSTKNALVSNPTNEVSNVNNNQVTDNTSNNNQSQSNNITILDSKIDNPVSSNNKVNSAITQSNSDPELDKNAVENALGLEKTQDAVALNAMKSDTPHNEKEKEENQKVGDSLAADELPSIEEEIAQLESINEKEEEKEELVNRWQVAANIAPVYYNSLGKGSHIDEQFVSNSKSGETNTSYGVNVSYALSKKLSVRSGVNSLNLSYDTDNVILYETPNGNTGGPSNPLRNINLAPQSQSLSAFSADNLGVQQVFDELYNAAISQRLSYYEVPVELEYKLVNNRFGLNIIGGVSTFFLDGNEVYSEFEEYKTYIGEANNVNNVSFSTNLGIGINYKFSETFKFNLEPTFKYQLNGFENTSGNFRPYIIGVYTGFSYKF